VQNHYANVMMSVVVVVQVVAVEAYCLMLIVVVVVVQLQLSVLANHTCTNRVDWHTDDIYSPISI
jgi:hypothetical protein